MSGPGGLQQYRDGRNLDIVLLHPARHKNCVNKRQAANGSGKDFLGEVGYIGPMPVALWGYKRVLTGIDI